MTVHITKIISKFLETSQSTANGKPVDATQELYAIGIANVASSFFQSFPITGSLSRSAVINSSGVRTPLSGLYTGLLVIAALLFFTPYFYYIPKSSLAGVIIAAVVFMVEVKVVKPMWRTKSKWNYRIAIAPCIDWWCSSLLFVDFAINCTIWQYNLKWLAVLPVFVLRFLYVKNYKFRANQSRGRKISVIVVKMNCNHNMC